MSAAPINLLVDFLFIDILAAPSGSKVNAVAVKSRVRQTMRRVSQVARRLSAASIASISAAKSKWWRAPSATFQVDTVRVVPDTTANAQDLAIISVGNLADNARKRIDNEVLDRKYNRSQAHVNKVQSRRDKRAHKNALQRQSSQRVAPSKEDRHRATTFSVTDAKIREVFAELCVDIVEQRKRLKRGQQERFDAAWGWVKPIHLPFYLMPCNV